MPKHFDAINTFGRYAPDFVISIALALLIVVLATGLRFVIAPVIPLTHIPYMHVFPAMLLATLWGRRLGGITALIASAIITGSYLAPILQRDDLIFSLISLVFVGGLMMVITEAYRKTDVQLHLLQVAKAEALAGQQEFLAQELTHRVNNTLALIDAIAVQTLGKCDQQSVLNFRDRVSALARAHEAITSREWAANLQDLIDIAIRPFDAKRFVIKGGPIYLSASQTLTMALALHELATNATKYGALSTDRGVVKIDWQTDDRFHFKWREEGGPPVQPSERKGFGSKLLRRTGETMGGTVRMEPAEKGYEFEINSPRLKQEEKASRRAK